MHTSTIIYWHISIIIYCGGYTVPVDFFHFPTLHPPRLPAANPHTSTTRHPRVRLCCAPSSTTEAARTYNNNNNMCTQKKTSLRIVYAAAEAQKYYTYTKLDTYNNIYIRKHSPYNIIYTVRTIFLYTHIALSEWSHTPGLALYCGIRRRPCDVSETSFIPDEDYRQNNNNNNQIGLFVDDVNPMSDTQQKRRFCTEKYLPTCVVFSYYAVVVSARGFMAVKTRKQ